jgi:hypothetical protein
MLTPAPLLEVVIGRFLQVMAEKEEGLSPTSKGEAVNPARFPSYFSDTGGVHSKCGRDPGHGEHLAP